MALKQIFENFWKWTSHNPQKDSSLQKIRSRKVFFLNLKIIYRMHVTPQILHPPKMAKCQYLDNSLS